MFSKVNLQILIFLFFNLFHIFSLAQPISDEVLNSIAKDRRWLALLHDVNLNNNKPYKSEIHGGSFFLSSNGKYDALAELKATLAAINSEEKIGLGPQVPLCAFRARYHYLSEKLNLNLPQVKCEKWETFYNGFNEPHKISLIFSSALPNSPASMFGHLFLKVSSKFNTDLLDTGVNYAAQVPNEDNGLTFLIYGVFGGYEGHWSVQPYYEKLNEYIKAESRDLWEYELNLTPQEVNFFVEHLWEIETTAKNYYYFFDDNCAYRIARIIEAIKPEWNTQEHSLSQHSIDSIPGEIVKNFIYKNQIAKINHKKSLQKKLNQRFSLLNDQEVELFKKNIKSETTEVIDLNKIENSERKIIFLNSLNSYYDYLRQKKKGQLTTLDKQKWQAVQNNRSELGPYTDPTTTVSNLSNQPELGHDSYSLGVSSHFSDQKDTLNNDSSHKNNFYTDVLIRSPYHEIYSVDEGYQPFSQILFPYLVVRDYQSKKRTEIGKINLIDIKSLSPSSFFDDHISWSLSAKYEDSILFSVTEKATTLYGAVGSAFYGFSENDIYYVLFGLKNEFYNFSQQKNKYFLISDIELGYVANLNKKHKIALVGKHNSGLNKSYDTQLVNNYSIAEHYTYSINRNIELHQSTQFSSQNITEFSQKNQIYELSLNLGLAYYYN